VFAAIVLVLNVAGVGGRAVDVLSVLVLLSRVLQSLVHVSHVQTDGFVAVRFSLLCVQLVSFAALIVILVRHAGAM
jgi:hypothetical protein